jgi:predicted RNA binding protein YcfA (HicA-like mRNA interferase family)
VYVAPAPTFAWHAVSSATLAAAHGDVLAWKGTATGGEKVLRGTGMWGPTRRVSAGRSHSAAGRKPARADRPKGDPLMRLTEIEQLLSEQGYTLERIRGSHRHYRHRETHRRLTITAHSGVHCRFTWRRLAEIRKDVERVDKQPPACHNAVVKQASSLR